MPPRKGHGAAGGLAGWLRATPHSRAPRAHCTAPRLVCRLERLLHGSYAPAPHPLLPPPTPPPPADVVGFTATQKDAELFAALGKAPSAAAYPNVARFYSHIASFSPAALAKLPAGFGSAAAAAAPAAAKPAAPAAAEEDVDLFGDDSGDAAAKISANAAAAAAAKVGGGGGGGGGSKRRGEATERGGVTGRCDGTITEGSGLARLPHHTTPQHNSPTPTPGR